MLGALEGAAPDPNDAATKACTPPPGRDYTKFLRADGLKGARIGIPRKNYYDAVHDARDASGHAAASIPSRSKVMEEAIAALKAPGAVVVDVDIPSIVPSQDAEGEPADSPVQSGCLSYGMKRDFNAWLASLGAAAPVKSLTELREWNKAHERMGDDQVRPDTARLVRRHRSGEGQARYEEDRARDIRLGGTNGIDAAVKANNLDALLFPGPERRGIARSPATRPSSCRSG